MGRHLLPGTPDTGPQIEIELRRSARARRLSLRVSRLDGRVTLTLPRRTPEAEGLAFVRDREPWLRRQLAGVGTALVPAFGTVVPYRGDTLTLTPGAVRRACAQGDRLVLPDDPARVAARTQAFLKLQARNALAVACDRHAAALGRSYGRLTLRDTRSRWGSCSAQGDLMFSWRLVMAPPPVLDYVAAHEVAHLAQMNHSPAFWAVCEQLYPDIASARDWLRRHGDTLHRVRFDAD